MAEYSSHARTCSKGAAVYGARGAMDVMNGGSVAPGLGVWGVSELYVVFRADSAAGARVAYHMRWSANSNVRTGWLCLPTCSTTPVPRIVLISTSPTTGTDCSRKFSFISSAALWKFALEFEFPRTSNLVDFATVCFPFSTVNFLHFDFQTLGASGLTRSNISVGLLMSTVKSNKKGVVCLSSEAPVIVSHAILQLNRKSQTYWGHCFTSFLFS